MKLPIRTKNTSIAFRRRTFGVVDAALNTPAQAGEAAEILNARYAPPDGADAPPADGVIAVDHHGVFANFGTELRSAHEGMVAANTAHVGQLARIVALQEQRDALSKGLLSRFLKARHGLEGLFGTSQGFPMLAVAGETPRDPTGLVHQVRETVDFLLQPKVARPSLDLAGFQIDLEATAAQLGGEADELDGVLTDLDRARKDADVTRQAKNEAIDRFDAVFLWVGRALESYFHLAGMHELAERVRPSARRPGRRAADEGSGSDAGEPPASDEPQPETEEPESGSTSSSES